MQFFCAAALGVAFDGKRREDARARSACHVCRCLQVSLATLSATEFLALQVDKVPCRSDKQCTYLVVLQRELHFKGDSSGRPKTACERNGVQGVASSNPAVPTIENSPKPGIARCQAFCFLVCIWLDSPPLAPHARDISMHLRAHPPDTASSSGASSRFSSAALNLLRAPPSS